MAGIYGALAVQGKPVPAIKEQRFVIVGAGSAGMGVTQMIALGMIKHVWTSTTTNCPTRRAIGCWFLELSHSCSIDGIMMFHACRMLAC